MRHCRPSLPPEHVACHCLTPLGSSRCHGRSHSGIHGDLRAQPSAPEETHHSLPPAWQRTTPLTNLFNFLQIDRDFSCKMGRKRKRTEHEGYVAWSDLELDAFLGDYTDMELRRGSSGSDSDVAVDSEPVPKKPRTSKPHKYLCPDCGSGLRTITGFRGHMRRKHNRTDVRGVLNSPRIALYTESSLLIFFCLSKSGSLLIQLVTIGKQKSTNWQTLWTCLVIVTYCLYLIHFYKKMWQFWFLPDLTLHGDCFS